MFDSIFTTSPTAAQFFIMALAAIVSGFIYAWIMSFKIRAKKRFFMVMAVIPFMVAAVIAFVGSVTKDLNTEKGYGIIGKKTERRRK